jgi:hypothetical protein
MKIGGGGGGRVDGVGGKIKRQTVQTMPCRE